MLLISHGRTHTQNTCPNNSSCRAFPSCRFSSSGRPVSGVQYPAHIRDMAQSRALQSKCSGACTPSTRVIGSSTPLLIASRAQIYGTKYRLTGCPTSFSCISPLTRVVLYMRAQRVLCRRPLMSSESCIRVKTTRS